MEIGTHFKAGRIIDVPAKIRRMLNECEDIKQTIEACTKVHLILESTRELWFVADYSYKARELCRLAWYLIDSMAARSSVRSYRALIKKFDPIRDALRRLEFEFHTDECDRLGFPKG